MDNETTRAEQYCGMRARDVFLENRDVFLEHFAALAERGLASDIRVFGSVARGDDDEESDIDLLVSVPRITGRIHWDIAVELSGWLDFPVHVVLDDGHGLLPERILKEAVPLMEISGKEKPAKEKDTEFLAECLEQILDHASLAIDHVSGGHLDAFAFRVVRLGNSLKGIVGRKGKEDPFGLVAAYPEVDWHGLMEDGKNTLQDFARAGFGEKAIAITSRIVALGNAIADYCRKNPDIDVMVENMRTLAEEREEKEKKRFLEKIASGDIRSPENQRMGQ